MQRLLPALLFALCCHSLLLLLPYSEDTVMPPRLPGEKTIRISLSGDVATAPEDNSPDIEESENGKKPAPPEEERKQVVVEKKTVPQQQKSVVPVTLHAQAIKKQIHPKPFHHKPSTTPAHKSSPQTARHTTEQTTVPVTVKATPLYGKNPKPEYPPLARRRDWQGTVMLSVRVSAKGDADRVTLHRSSGYPLLDKSALKTVKTWHFLPGTEGDRPVAMEVLIPVHFKLR